MPTEFQRPTPLELIARIATDIEGALIGVNARLRGTVEYVLSRALAGVFHGVHGHIAWVAEQIIVDQAVERFVVRWGDLFGVVRNQAKKAHPSITVTGTGGALPADTIFVRRADSFTFVVDTAVASVTNETVALTASVAGAIGNLQVNEKLYLVSSIDGVVSEATVSAVGTPGTDLETIPNLLLRILDRIQRPPMGGAPGDYETWAKAAGATRAWEYRGTDGVNNPGLGKVAVTFVFDNRIDIIPTVQDIAAMQAYLDARAPSEVFAFAPTPEPYDSTVRPTPDTSAVRLAIAAEVADMLKRDAIPGGTIELSRFNEAVSAAEGETSHVTSSPTADKSHAFGKIAVPGTITWA